MERKKIKNRKKYKDLILKVRKITFSKMKSHTTKGIGISPILYRFSDEINNPKGKIFVASRILKNVKNSKPHVKLHKHTVDQMYMWIGSKNDMRGLVIEVFLENESYILETPVAVYIPAGISHSHRYIKGSGYFVGILLTGGKSYNEVTL
jgi:hypothetical protein